MFLWTVLAALSPAFARCAQDSSEVHAPRCVRFGRALATLDDLDGGGVPEFAVGVSGASTALSKECGSVLIYSGEQLELTRRIDGPELGLGFGAALRVVADLDEDGVQELLVTCEAQSLIQVVDPQSGVALWSYRPATPFRDSPYLAFADVDGDGVADHLLASPLCNRAPW